MQTLADLKPDKKNARKHNPRNIGMIVDALREVGVARSGVIDEEGNILAGSGIYEALSEAGIEKIKVVEADGNEWVVVKRSGLTAEQKVKLALYDNRTAELADWDTGNMELLQDDFPEIFDKLFSEDELVELMDDGGPGELEGEDDAPQPPEKARTCLGDMYKLGDHILMCGDSTDNTQVDQLMDGQKADMVFTDPPYALFGNSTGVAGITDDKMTAPFFYAVFAQTQRITKLFGHIYICCDWHSAFALQNQARKAGLTEKNLCIWDKGDGGMGAMYQNCYEMVWFYANSPLATKTHGQTKSGERTINGRPNIWRFSRASGDRLHNAMKPIELISNTLDASSEVDELVLDLFGGSGSTLIACQKLKRKCYMMELDPCYCDVIVTRFKDLFPDDDIYLKVKGNNRWHKREWGVKGALTL